MARGTKVSPQASPRDVSILQETCSREVFKALYGNIYKHFDGFSETDFDENSFLRVWTIQEIVSSPYTTKDFTPFMDFSLNSEIYGMMEGLDGKVVSKFANKTTSVTIDSLLSRLINGDFDDTLGLP